MTEYTQVDTVFYTCFLLLGVGGRWLAWPFAECENFAKVAKMIERMPELRTLSPSDKLTLVTELWDDLASNPEDIPITPEQIAEVDRRLEEYRKNPDLGSTWEEVKARILGQNR